MPDTVGSSFATSSALRGLSSRRRVCARGATQAIGTREGIPFPAGVAENPDPAKIARLLTYRAVRRNTAKSKKRPEIIREKRQRRDVYDGGCALPACNRRGLMAVRSWRKLNGRCRPSHLKGR